MLGLPSTTEIPGGRRIPKEAFYRNLDVSADLRRSFVERVERIDVLNSVKSASSNLSDGRAVHEVLVMGVALKRGGLPTDVVLAVESANPSRKVYRASFEGEVCLAVVLDGEVVESGWLPEGQETLSLHGQDMDAAWDAMASQVAFGDAGRWPLESVEARHARMKRVAGLQAELAALERKLGKEKQIVKKNALYEKITQVERALDAERNR